LTCEQEVEDCNRTKFGSLLISHPFFFCFSGVPTIGCDRGCSCCGCCAIPIVGVVVVDGTVTLPIAAVVGCAAFVVFPVVVQAVVVAVVVVDVVVAVALEVGAWLDDFVDFFVLCLGKVVVVAIAVAFDFSVDAVVAFVVVEVSAFVRLAWPESLEFALFVVTLAVFRNASSVPVLLSEVLLSGVNLVGVVVVVVVVVVASVVFVSPVVAIGELFEPAKFVCIVLSVVVVKTLSFVAIMCSTFESAADWEAESIEVREVTVVPVVLVNVESSSDDESSRSVNLFWRS
jgi:hypothetical protein